MPVRLFWVVALLLALFENYGDTCVITEMSCALPPLLQAQLEAVRASMSSSYSADLLP